MEKKLIIEISGGCLVSIKSNKHEYMEVVLIDWDNLKQGPVKERRRMERFLNKAKHYVQTIY